MSERNTFEKSERLCSRKLIETLFASGKSVSAFPFRVQYLFVQRADNEAVSQVMFPVPKKRFKRAVRRNLIRRRAKEAFRLNKNLLYADIPKDYAIIAAFIYIDSTIQSYDSIQKGILKAFEKLRTKKPELFDNNLNSLNICDSGS